jgi:hypothetical protein
MTGRLIAMGAVQLQRGVEAQWGADAPDGKFRLPAPQAELIVHAGCLALRSTWRL